MAIGTVADVAPLVGENRRLVKQGLAAIAEAGRPGLRALIEVGGLQPGGIDTEAIGYGLAPRLNAAGRLAHAELSLRWLDPGQWEALLADLRPWSEESGTTAYWELVRDLFGGLPASPGRCHMGTAGFVVDADGSVYPCSQLVAPRFWAGNLMEENPALIWRGSPVLRKFRNLRSRRAFRQTLCGACRAVERCGGCPAMSDDGCGADPGCPEPLLPPKKGLGRDGRIADLRRYLDSHHSISVAEYIDRYGVGQKRAVSALLYNIDLPDIALILLEYEGHAVDHFLGKRGFARDKFE